MNKKVFFGYSAGTDGQNKKTVLFFNTLPLHMKTYSFKKGFATQFRAVGTNCLGKNAIEKEPQKKSISLKTDLSPFSFTNSRFNILSGNSVSSHLGFVEKPSTNEPLTTLSQPQTQNRDADVFKNSQVGSISAGTLRASKTRITHEGGAHTNKSGVLWPSPVSFHGDANTNQTVNNRIYNKEYKLETFHRSNQDTCLTHKPAVTEGDWVQSGDFLTDCANSVGGELSLGQNIFIAYMPWEGYNFEDAILISERLVTDDLFTSVHIERYEIENLPSVPVERSSTKRTKENFLNKKFSKVAETKLPKLKKNKVDESQSSSLNSPGSQIRTARYEEITRDIPDVKPEEVNHLDSFGIVKIGSVIEEGDILVGKITPINKKEFTPYQKLLYTILDKQIRPYRDSSLRAPKGIKAKVIDIKIFVKPGSVSLSPKVFPSMNRKGGFITPVPVVPKTQNAINPSLVSAKSISDQYTTKYNKTKKSRTKTIQKKKKGHRLIRTFQTVMSRKLHNSNIIKKMKKGLPVSYSYSSLRSFMGLTNNIARSAMRADETRESARSENNIGKQQNIYSPKSIKDIETIHIYLAEKRKIQVGDKMSGRHGNKGIVSQILPIQDMPFLPDGTPIDMVLNPLGVPSRMNVGQIYECLLGLAGKYLGEHYKIFSFDEIYGPEASRSLVFSKLYEARCKTGFKWLFNSKYPGKIRLFDGRTGDCYHQPVTVGQAYMLRLVHMVDDKIHMRSTGPYSLVTQQPLRGRSKQGGQRLGEMEVWALEGYGAAFTLLEMLTVKSDDLTGRMTLWSNLILNKDLTIGTPEAFKVLICELQALCLDIGLFRYNTTTPKTYPDFQGEEIDTNFQSQDIRTDEKSPFDLTNKSKLAKGSYPTKSLTEMTSLMSFP